jgi:SAM-dependent methyltransferase
MAWTYTAKDVGIVLFDACLTAGAPMTFAPGAKVLEIGSCESDWLERAKVAWPETEFAGIDVRADKHNRPYRWKRNVMDADIFQPETFDAIVSLSAIEHIGLGHYGDPLEPIGDITAVSNAWRWLKPGGWFYLDVPYDPKGYRVQGTKCRVYDEQALYARLNPRGCTEWYAFADASHPGTLIPQPVQSIKPFHYVAMVFSKPPRKAD